MNIPKYRAWHKQQKRMGKAEGMSLDPKYGCVHVHLDGENVWHWCDDIELMPILPMRDKKETEIYKDDILELNCLGYGGPYKDRVVVVWEGFGWHFRFPDGRLQAIEQKWQSECEVIGNIWENSDLLTQEQQSQQH